MDFYAHVNMAQILKKPSHFLHFTESIRAFFETVRGFIFYWFAKKTTEGDQRPILVVPGLLTSDISTIILRKYLTKKGFKVYGWEMGTNLGRLHKLPMLIKNIKGHSDKHNQKIILIGWSMGGLFCREVCHQMPQYISQVITLGSPFVDIHAPNNAKWVFDLLNDSSKVDQELIKRLPLQTTMPSLSIFSRKDGIVAWQVCKDKAVDVYHQNIEVSSSHFGMGAHPEVLKIIFANIISMSNINNVVNG